MNILANTREEARAKLGSLDPSGLAALRASSTALAAASAASASSGSGGKPLVGIIMGSDSDLATMKGAAQVGGGRGWHVAEALVVGVFPYSAVSVVPDEGRHAG